MTTIIYGSQIDSDIEYLRSKLIETTDINERKKLERTIEILQDSIVMYRLDDKLDNDKLDNDKLDNMKFLNI